jgi:hypothetical protein
MPFSISHFQEMVRKASSLVQTSSARHRCTYSTVCTLPYRTHVHDETHAMYSTVQYTCEILYEEMLNSAREILCK